MFSNENTERVWEQAHLNGRNLREAGQVLWVGDGGDELDGADDRTGRAAMIVRPSHTSTGGTGGIGVVEGRHWERACVPWVRMLLREEKWRHREEWKKRGTGAQTEKRERKNRRGTMREVTEALSNIHCKHDDMIHAFGESTCCTRHTDDKVVKRCQTPDCSKKRNLWWLISDSIDIWTQRQKGLDTVEVPLA